MSLRPLGHRILVQPDAPSTESAGGLILLETRHHVPVSGTVVAVGDGLARDQRIRQAAIARCTGIVEELAEQFPNSTEYANALRDEMGRYRCQAGQMEPGVHLGDTVAFPAQVGMTVTEDGQAYIILNEDDVIVVAEAESVAA
jgi:co-chaperonin GroES (HSP10)